MLDSLNDTGTPSILATMKADFAQLDNTLGKSGKRHHKKKHKNKHKNKARKARCNQQLLAQLAFQNGVLTCRYETLRHMVGLAVAAKRGQLDDQLLEGGLVALGHPRTIYLPEP